MRFAPRSSGQITSAYKMKSNQAAFKDLVVSSLFEIRHKVSPGQSAGGTN